MRTVYTWITLHVDYSALMAEICERLAFNILTQPQCILELNIHNYGVFWRNKETGVAVKEEIERWMPFLWSSATSQLQRPNLGMYNLFIMRQPKLAGAAVVSAVIPCYKFMSRCFWILASGLLKFMLFLRAQHRVLARHESITWFLVR